MATNLEEKKQLSDAWEVWCRRGSPSVRRRRCAALRCMNERGEIRGYYSDLVLDPTLPETHALYPSIEHTTFPKQHDEIVVETRVVNDMKGILSEEEFWHAIEHLFTVGAAQKKIPSAATRRDTLSPVRHYGKRG
jgi:hypothetical protein